MQHPEPVSLLPQPPCSEEEGMCSPPLSSLFFPTTLKLLVLGDQRIHGTTEKMPQLAWCLLRVEIAIAEG